jgi:hypothetical protein
MLQRTLQALTLACGVVAATLAAPTESRAACRLIDCLFGTAPAAASATTYAPPYVPAPVYAAPACQPCATVAPNCAPCSVPCLPQTCEYMPAAVAPTVAYRPYVAYAPVVAAAYQPVVGTYAVTRYRPFLGTYETRLVPYTTYRSYYAPAVAYYAPTVGYTAAYAYSPAASCSSCGCGSCGYSSCGSCGFSSCGSCETGGCGAAVYGVPSSGCSSCNVASSAAVAPTTDAGSSAPRPQTFEDKANKPIPDKAPEPIPATDTKSTTLPLPTLPDPNGRTASIYRSLNSSAHVQFVAKPASPPPAEADEDGWHAPRE